MRLAGRATIPAMKLRAPLQLLGLLALAIGLSGGSCVWAFKSDPDGDGAGNGNGGGAIIVVQSATFGGPSMAARLADLPGVIKSETGWDGPGTFYGAWLASWTGHRRVSRLQYDPARISFEQLLTAARERSKVSSVSFYARDAAQAAAARAAWPVDLTPRLVLRRAASFRSAAE
jgi:hypothetical protein